MILMTHRPIETRSDAGPNGWLLPIWNSGEDDWRPEQVYLTVVAPGARKGPHLHKKRWGRFTCIKGNALIIMRVPTHMGLAYQALWSGEDYQYATIEVRPGIPAAVYNLGTAPAYVLNMPSPPWRADDQDEWPVEGWEFQPIGGGHAA